MTSLSTCTTVQDELTRHLVERLDSDKLDLPMLPDTAMQVMEMANGDTADAADLARALERDMSLAGHVLRVANSAAYAPNQEIVSLQQAVGRLGMRTVSEIAIAVALKGRAFNVKGYENRIKKLWVHSSTAAAWAREIARKRRRNVEGAFLSGLMHDVGKPIVLQTAIDFTGEQGVRPDPERLARWMNDYHEEIGARLVLSWKLPEWMADVARFHHRPHETESSIDQVHMVRLADIFSHWTMNPTEEAEMEIEESPSLAPLGIYQDDLEELYALRDQVLEVSEAYS
jgi:putative nucleotidyltransferase with HDIG domain